MNCELKKFSNNMISTKLYAVPGKLFTVSIPEEQIGKVMVSYQYDLYLVISVSQHIILCPLRPLNILSDISEENLIGP